jgi:hypothetical protein
VARDLRAARLLGLTERAAVRYRTGHSAGPRLTAAVEHLHAGELAIHPDLRPRIQQPRHDAARHVIEQVGRSAALLDPPHPVGTGPRPEVVSGALPAQRAGLFQLRGGPGDGPVGPVAPYAAVGPGAPPPERPPPRSAPPPPPEEGGLFDPFDGLVEIVRAEDPDGPG